jgi:hypothetical protein
MARRAPVQMATAVPLQMGVTPATSAPMQQQQQQQPPAYHTGGLTGFVTDDATVAL